jgi:hypothetical protein
VKWASWTVKKVVHRLHLDAKITACGLPAQFYTPTWKPRGYGKPQPRLLKDKKRRKPTCLECVVIEAEFGEP